MNCNIVISFLPNARESYAAVIGGDPARCKLAVLRSSGKSPVVEPSARKRSWKMPVVSNSEAQCDGEAATAR